MTQKTSKEKLRIAAAAMDPKVNLAALAASEGLSRPTIYRWRSRLLQSDELIFGSGNSPARIYKEEAEENKKLRAENQAFRVSQAQAAGYDPDLEDENDA